MNLITITNILNDQAHTFSELSVKKTSPSSFLRKP